MNSGLSCERIDEYEEAIAKRYGVDAKRSCLGLTFEEWASREAGIGSDVEVKGGC